MDEKNRAALHGVVEAKTLKDPLPTFRDSVR